MRKILVYSSLPLLIVLSMVLYVNISFSGLQTQPFYDDCRKVWGHRGYFKEHEMNSLAGFEQAFDLGAAGVEMDIRYDGEEGRFVVSHGYPYAMKEGSLLYLEDVFRDLGHRGYFWLDFKNLKDLDRDQCRASAREMVRLLESHGLVHRAIVESKDPGNLAVYAEAGIPTSFWISVDPKMGPAMAVLRTFAKKAAFLYGGFTAVSMNYLHYTDALERSLGNVPVHLFTVNDEVVLRDLILRPNVKIVLTDENFFTLEGCE